MADENIKQNSWQLPFIIVLSLFLVVTFVFYLPLRFRSGIEMMDEMMDDRHYQEETMEGGAMMDHGGHEAVYHEENEITEGLVASLNILDVPYSTGRPLYFNFWINEMPGRTPVALDDLEIEHEVLMHVIGVRSDLEGFFHIHPEADTGTAQANHLMATHTLDFPGRYKIWSEIKKDGVNHVFGHPEITVLGNGPTENKKVSFARNVMVGPYQLSLFVKEPVSKGGVQHLSFDLHTPTGRELGTENYLGEPMHLTIIKDDWSQFIHAHPNANDPGHGLWPIKMAQAHGGVEDDNAESVGIDKTIDFDIIFPAAGLYKVFAQFRPEGSNLPADEVLLAPFWIEVQEKTPSVVSSQIWLVLVSVILIIILSLTVSRYLKVKLPKASS